MTKLLDNYNFLRYKQDFDYSKVPIIRNDHTLSLDPELAPNNWIDELRIANAVKNPPRPKIIPEIDLIELERLKEYGERVYIQPESLHERLCKKVLKVPARRVDGTVIHDPPLPPAQRSQFPVRGANPVMRNMTFSELLNSPSSLADRVNQLLTNLNLLPAQLELAIINQHLVNQALQAHPQQPMPLSFDETLDLMFQQVPVDQYNILRQEMDSSRGAFVSPQTELLQQGTRSIAIYKMVRESFEATPASVVISGYQRFIRQHFSQEFSINLNDSIRAFRQSGGPNVWFQTIQAIDIGPGPAQILPQTQQQLSTSIEEEKKETKEEEEESQLLDIADITLLFEDEGISLPEDGGYLDNTWYMQAIQTASLSHNDPNYGHRSLFVDLVNVMEQDDNQGQNTFIKELVGIGRPSEGDMRNAEAVVNGIKSGIFRIRKVSKGNYQLEIMKEKLKGPKIEIEPMEGPKRIIDITGELRKVNVPMPVNNKFDQNWISSEINQDQQNRFGIILNKLIMSKNNVSWKTFTVFGGGVNYISSNNITNDIFNGNTYIKINAKNDYEYVEISEIESFFV